MPEFFPSRTVTVYMARLFLTRSFAVLALLVLVLQALDLLGESDKILSVPGNGQAQILEYISLRSPGIVQRFLPFSVLLGTLIARIDTARFTRTLGTLVQSGVPLLNALNLSRPVLFNQVLGQSVDVASNDVKTGSGLAYALAKQKSFPRLAVQMIQVGEESGELDIMLLKVADTFDTEANHSISRLMAVLLPALTLLMTFMVFIIILAVLLPIFDITGAVL